MPPSSIQYLSMNPETQIHFSLSTMISRAISSGFPNNNVPQGLHMFPVTEDLVSPSSAEAASNSGSGDSHSSSLLFSLSLLKDKLSQVQNLVGVLLSPDQSLPESTNSMVISSMNSTIQEIIVTATSMMFTCQQIALTNSTPPGTTATTCTEELHHHQHQSHHNNRLTQSNFTNNRSSLSNIAPDIRGQSFFSSNNESEALQDWFGERYNNNNNDNNHHNNNNNNANFNLKHDDRNVAISETNNDDNTNNDEVYRGLRGVSLSPKNNNYDIIELDAADLLAKYTHYCQVCGKGFKRDANLRMHMRAHGDEYKTNSALSNPMKNKGRDCNLTSTINTKPKKYSCPQEGCRWNKKHAKFQPLKSIICAKNHYKRSHCPKMYVCKRCNQKQFSVLSDLRTHEKHCGDLKWQCSCGTTFSRKDKLMGHVALFLGHHPAIDGTSSR